VFKNSKLGKLHKNEPDIPNSTVLPSHAGGLCIPFVLMGDEVFALSEHVLQPYPKRNLSFLKCVYHYRLSRACEGWWKALSGFRPSSGEYFIDQ
jgi:hypothetical protein